MGAWFAPEVRTFSRGKGDAPATAKAAYRAGICITDTRTGVTYDYSYRTDIDHSALARVGDAHTGAISGFRRGGGVALATAESANFRRKP